MEEPSDEEEYLRREEADDFTRQILSASEVNSYFLTVRACRPLE